MWENCLANEHLVRSGCKINLYLEITGRLPNGYHTLKTFILPLAPQERPQDSPMVRPGERPDVHSDQTPAGPRDGICALPDIPFDTLHIRPGNDPGLNISSNVPYLDPLNNTLQKAYTLYAAQVSAVPDLAIYLEKEVPHGAGLGGGSADAAALLLFLESCLKSEKLAPLGPKRLAELAAKIGADVPFFLLNRPAWAEGIGEKFTPAPLPFNKKYLLLVCPKTSVSTAWAYAAWDDLFLTSQGAQDTNSCAAKNATREERGCFFNSFEEVVFYKHPELADIKRQLLDLQADTALMSGSGSSIFGLFEQFEKAERASEILRDSGLAVYCRAIHAGASPSW